MRVNLILYAPHFRPVRKGGSGGYEDPLNSQKCTKKVHTVCISKIQGSFITL